MFKDYVKIKIKSGKGGDGHVSFRRELYVPNGGPDGGDGGRGGDIIFEVDKSINTLSSFYHNKKYKAEDGEPGGKRKCHGKDGKDLIIKVPEGTLIRHSESNKIIADMSNENNRAIILKGGKGGIGNMHYATSVMQAPRYAKPGGESLELEVVLELKLIADVGLIGFPNVGKSTLLSLVSSAKVEIANYPFTTINPHLGVVKLNNGNSFVMADIPGIIEGAAKGKGLGLRFLRHIERNKILVHVVDLSLFERDNPVDDIEKINNELLSYSKSLLEIPQVIVGNKCDVAKIETIQKVEDYCKKNHLTFFKISAATNEGIKSLLTHITDMLSKTKESQKTFTPEFNPLVDIKQDNLNIVVEKEGDVYFVSGSGVEKMLGYTNLESEKGFVFFQKFIKEKGIEDKLINLGINDGDTVNIMGYEFEFYR